MSIFKHSRQIVSEELTYLLDRAEDPGLLIKQIVLEIREAVAIATALLAKALAGEKQLKWKNKLQKTTNQPLPEVKLLRKQTDMLKRVFAEAQMKESIFFARTCQMPNPRKEKKLVRPKACELSNCFLIFDRFEDKIQKAETGLDIDYNDYSLPWDYDFWALMDRNPVDEELKKLRAKMKT